MKNLWLMLFVAPMLTYAGTNIQEEDYDEPVGQYELAMDDDSLADETLQTDVAVSKDFTQNYYDEMLSEEATEEFIETAPVVAERSTASKQVAQTQQQKKNVSGDRQTNVNRSQAGNNSRQIQREQQSGNVQQKAAQRPAERSGASNQARPRVTQRGAVGNSTRSQVRESAPSVVYDEEGQYTQPARKQYSSKRSSVSNERQERREGRVSKTPHSSRENNNSRVQSRARQNKTAYSEKGNRAQTSKMQAKKRVQKVPAHHSGKRPRDE